MFLARYISNLNPFGTKNAQANNKPKKTYSRKATGAASATVKRRSKENDLKLFGSCFWLVILCVL